MEVIRELCSFEGRLAGTDAERRAANRLAERLREGGRRVEVEPTYVHPQYALVIALHCLLGDRRQPGRGRGARAGLRLVLFAATSMYLDLNTRFYSLRRLFFRRASQNVVSRGAPPDAPARLILTAHYDAARTGLRLRAEAGAPRRLAQRPPILLGPFRVLFWSLAAAAPVTRRADGRASIRRDRGRSSSSPPWSC